MEYIPVVFFSVFFFVVLRKKGFDACAFVTLLYVITSVFSLIMFRMHLVEEKYSHPSLIATLSYCVLLFISIYPLYRIDFRHISLQVTTRTEKIVKVLTFFFFCNLILFLFLKIEAIYQIIVSGDFLILRQDFMSDDVGHATGFKGVLFILTNIVSSISFVMIFIFFISITYFKNKWWFNLIAFLGSLPQVLSGILTINRSNIFYYIIMFALCYVIFKKRVSTRVKVRLFLPVGITFAAMLLFFSSVTISRFEDTSTSYGSANNSLISYAGMPYSNYCYFFDHYNNPDWMSTRYLFPVTNFIFNGYRAGIEREQEMSTKTGFNCVAFMTFLGSFIMDSNRVTQLIFLAIYLFLFRLCRSHIHTHYISFKWFLLVFLLAIIPAIGCLSYYYNNPFSSMALYTLLFYISRIKGL